MTHAARPETRMTSSKIVAWMVAAIALLGAVAYWDEERKAYESLTDFATEQVMVARAAANAFREWPGEAQSDDDLVRGAATRLRAIEQPGSILVLLRRPGATDFLKLDGSHIVSPPLAARFASGGADSAWVRLTHPEATALGLPPRTAIAGIAEIDRGKDGRWGLVVVSTAERERDREERGLWRVGLGFLIASAIVVAAGTLALRMQRQELALEHRLEVAEAVQARDERLVRADKLASLGAFAMGIAHQVATPLGVIVGRAERLAPRLGDDERSRKSVTVIAEQAQRINRIIRSFLRLARGAAPALEHVDPRELATTAVELVRHRLEKAHVAVEVDRSAVVPMIACDARLFEQVLVNLLLNACDACDQGGHVKLGVEATAGGVAFVVLDDGVGITATAAARATEPFYSTKPPDEGSGLGLAIAREIVVHHRGTLTIEPASPRGTRARVEVPSLSPESTEA
jgi:two-component system, NtrC family, sensor kinase